MQIPKPEETINDCFLLFLLRFKNERAKLRCSIEDMAFAFLLMPFVVFHFAIELYVRA